MNDSFVFLCDESTEGECLSRNMLGTTMSNALWAATVKPGDQAFLFNFVSGKVIGPFQCVSTVDNYIPEAWAGRFPLQVKIELLSSTMQGDGPKGSDLAFLHSKRKPDVLSERQVIALRHWLDRNGTFFPSR
jgi:hypothetical protein